MKYCKNCGAELDDNIKYCPTCGAKQDDMDNVNNNEEEQVEYVEEYEEAPQEEVEYVEEYEEAPQEEYVEEVHYVDAETGEEVEYVEEPYEEGNSDAAAVVMAAEAVKHAKPTPAPTKTSASDAELEELERRKELLMKKKQLQEEINALEGQQNNYQQQGNFQQNPQMQQMVYKPKNSDIVPKIRGLIVFEGIVKLASAILMCVILYMMIYSVIFSYAVSASEANYVLGTDYDGETGLSLINFIKFASKVSDEFGPYSEELKNSSTILLAMGFGCIGLLAIASIFVIIGLIKGIIAFVKGLSGSPAMVKSHNKFPGVAFFMSLFTFVPALGTMVLMCGIGQNMSDYKQFDYFLKNPKELKFEKPLYVLAVLGSALLVLYIFSIVIAVMKGNRVRKAEEGEL